MTCEQCSGRIPLPRRADARYCSAACRQRAYRARRVRADGKRPIMPDGRPASSTRACTWSSFSEVQAGAGDGYGVMLGGGLACWDLDVCFDGGVLAGWAREALEGVAPLFVERSMSGR